MDLYNYFLFLISSYFSFKPDEKANIPVMVCIHSGGFLRGESAECFPTYFMDKRIVIVSFDYRLGIFGENFHLSLNIITGVFIGKLLL